MPHLGPDYPATAGHDEDTATRTARSDAELYVQFHAGFMGIDALAGILGSRNAADVLVARRPTATEYAQIMTLREQTGATGYMPPMQEPLSGTSGAPTGVPGADDRERAYNPATGQVEYQTWDGSAWQFTGQFPGAPPKPDAAPSLKPTITVNGPQGYGVYERNADGTLGAFLGNSQAPKDPSAAPRPDTITINGPQGFGSYLLKPDGTLGAFIGDTRAPKEPSAAEMPSPTSQGKLDEMSVRERLDLAQSAGWKVSQEGKDWIVVSPTGTTVRYVAEVDFSSPLPGRTQKTLAYRPVTSVGPAPAPMGGLQTMAAAPGATQQPVASSSAPPLAAAPPPRPAAAASPKPQGGLSAVAPTPYTSSPPPPSTNGLPQGGAGYVYAPEYGGYMTQAMYDSIPANWNKPPIQGFNHGGTVSTSGSSGGGGNADALFAAMPRGGAINVDDIKPENRANYQTSADIDRESARTSAYNAGAPLWQQATKAATGYSVPMPVAPRPRQQGGLISVLPQATSQGLIASPTPPPPLGYTGPMITPPNTGPMDMGPAGRTFDQITGTQYLSDDERAWYLGQIGKTVPQAGGAAPVGVGPAGRTVAQVRGTEYLSEEERQWYLSQNPQSPVRTQALGYQPAAGPVGGLREVAITAATKYGAPSDIFDRMMTQENGYKTTGTSSVGAQGVAQLMPATAAMLGVDPNNPQQALDGAARYLSQMIKYFGGDVAKGVAAYNAGPGNVEKAIRAGGENWRSFLPEETQHYLAVTMPTQGYAKGTPKGGLVLDEEAHIIGLSGRDYGVIGEPTPTEPMGQQEKLEITPLHKDQTPRGGLIPDNSFADGGFIFPSFQNGSVLTPEQQAQIGASLQMFNQSGSISGGGVPLSMNQTTPQSTYQGAYAAAAQQPAMQPLTSRTIQQGQPFTYPANQAYLGLQGSNLNALQRENTAMNSAQDNWQDQQNVAMGERDFQSWINPRLAAGGLQPLAQIQRPLTGIVGRAAPGTRWALETVSQRLGRTQQRAQTERALNLQEAGLDVSKAGFRENELGRVTPVLVQEFRNIAADGKVINDYALEVAIRRQDWSSVAKMLGASPAEVKRIAGRQSYAKGGAVTAKPKGGLVAA